MRRKSALRTLAALDGQVYLLSNRLTLQLIPVIRWIAATEHFSKYRVRIVLASGGAQRLLVVNPRVDNYPGARVVTKKQAKPPSDPGSSPMPEGGPHGVALPVFISSWIARDGLKHQCGQRRIELDVGILGRVFGIARDGPVGGRFESLQLLPHTTMEQ